MYGRMKTCKKGMSDIEEWIKDLLEFKVIYFKKTNFKSLLIIKSEIFWSFFVSSLDYNNDDRSIGKKKLYCIKLPKDFCFDEPLNSLFWV